MKKILLGIVALVLIGCGDRATSKIGLEDTITALLNSHPLPPQTAKNLIDEAKTIIQKSEKGGYGLLSSQELHHLIEQNNPIIIIDTSANGNYLLGHIANAKGFELPKNTQEMTSQMMQKFQKKLGHNKDSLIVIYDEGNTPTNQTPQAILAVLWAKKLGYNNVYWLTGGLNAWKERQYPLTQDKPKCCSHE